MRLQAKGVDGSAVQKHRIAPAGSAPGHFTLLSVLFIYAIYPVATHLWEPRYSAAPLSAAIAWRRMLARALMARHILLLSAYFAMASRVPPLELSS